MIVLKILGCCVLFLIVTLCLIIAVLPHFKFYRKWLGGTWYKVYKWHNDPYDVLMDSHIVYWTRKKPEEYEGLYSGLKVEKIEMHV